MAIQRPLHFYRIIHDLVPRLDLAHSDLAGIVALLRDVGVAVWTIEAPFGGYSLRGWREHFAGEYQRFENLRNLAGARIQATFPEVAAAAVDYLDALPRLNTAFNTVLDLHAPGGVLVNEAVTQPQRNALANAIAAELAA